jgi:hypothetical protein
MNAYELADKLDWVCENHLVAIGDADFKATANMLRHQADYIAQLEKGLDSVTEFSKAQVERIAELERKHKAEFDYAEKLLKERDK